jgi:D-mannonate dehydratase
VVLTRGHFLNFHETLQDNGCVNILPNMRAYKEVGYDAIMMPNDAPQIDGATGKQRAFAFEFGYISEIIQAVQNEA